MFIWSFFKTQIYPFYYSVKSFSYFKLYLPLLRFTQQTWSYEYLITKLIHGGVFYNFCFIWEERKPHKFETGIPVKKPFILEHYPMRYGVYTWDYYIYGRDHWITCFKEYLSHNNLYWIIIWNNLLFKLKPALKRTFGFGFYYIQGFALLLFIDACLTDDEPLWEPIEWSLVQTWLLFICIFAWIAENLIVSRYGSYTGRDKRVWMAWYKTFWLIELYYLINFGAILVFICVPFYYELNYNLSFVVTWWHWYSRVFFFKFISLFSIVLLISYLLQSGSRWLFWKKGLVLVVTINVFISYLLYTHFIMSFFGYFTDPIWYQKTKPIDYIQLSHEPSKWGWGPAKKDHFTYHSVRTVFWFKSDGPYASSFLLIHLFVFLTLFFLYIYWIVLFRRVYSTCELPITYITYCVSSLRQFFYFFLMLYLLILLSYIAQYWRFPLEELWVLDYKPWFINFLNILQGYPHFIYQYCIS